MPARGRAAGRGRRRAEVIDDGGENEPALCPSELGSLELAETAATSSLVELLSANWGC